MGLISFHGKAAPIALIISLSLIVRVRVVPRRTVVGDIDRRFDNLSRSHHQSQVNCVSLVFGVCCLFKKNYYKEPSK